MNRHISVLYHIKIKRLGKSAKDILSSLLWFRLDMLGTSLVFFFLCVLFDFFSLSLLSLLISNVNGFYLLRLCNILTNKNFLLLHINSFQKKVNAFKNCLNRIWLQHFGHHLRFKMCTFKYNNQRKKTVTEEVWNWKVLFYFIFHYIVILHLHSFRFFFFYVQSIIWVVIQGKVCIAI